MKVRLLFPDRDADLGAQPSAGSDDLVDDLDLGPVLETMVPGRRLEKLCPAVLFNPLTDPEQIRWRQHVLSDALANPDAMRHLFDLAGQALESQHSVWMWSGRTADSLLSKSVHGLRALLPLLRELAGLAAQQLATVRSAGLSELYRRLIDELDASYLDQVAAVLTHLNFPEGVVTRAHLTNSGLIGDMELLAPASNHRSLWARLGFAPPGRQHFTIAERDEAGARALAEMRDDALHDAAGTLAEANAHVVGFFRQLQWEAGFYVGCLQLCRKLQAAGVGTCWPDPCPDGAELSAEGLVSLSLAVRSGRAPIPNDLAGPSVPLAIVTGANQGGKTTLLRSIGCAQLLLQAGVFVPASAYRASLATALHTHFRRAEDDDLRSGKLDEELARMSTIVDRCHPGDLLLMNESFASTDEVEGSWIAADVIDALIGHGVRVVLVTHFHALAQHYLSRPGTVFLVAERLPDGRRSHRVLPGRPQATSHGLDIFRHSFGETTPETSPVAAGAPTPGQRLGPGVLEGRNLT
jgi:hypothetical protein